jgi:hypothetical protein
LGIFKFMPNITTKKATINFLDKKFIFLKKWHLILRIICHIVVIVNRKHHIIIPFRFNRETDKNRLSFRTKKEGDAWILKIGYLS